MTRAYRFVFLAVLCVLTACGGDNAPETLASADVDGVSEATAAAESESEVEATTTTTSAPTAIEWPSTTDAPTTTAAPTTTTAAPTTTTSTTTTTTTSTTTTSSTTTIPAVPSCSTANYTVVIPNGWVEQDCRSFTSGVFPEPDAPIEFRPEIGVDYTTAETYAQSLARINATEDVVSSTATTVNGFPGERLVVADTGWFMDGERVIVVADAGTGVFFARVNEVIDIQGPLQGGDHASHYAFSSAAFDAILSTVVITP